MRIGIDCRVMTRRPTGISKYLADAIIAIHEYIPDWELYLIAPEMIHSETLSLEGERIIKIISPLPVFNKHLLWYNTEFVRLCCKYKVDLIWSPFPERPIYVPGHIRQMVTVHDVVALEYQKTQSWHNKFFGVLNFKKSIMQADLIWCNSHYTHGKIDDYFPVRKQKEVLVADSCSELFRKRTLSEEEKTKIKQEYGITDQFLLFVGTLEPRKNLVFLLDVMKRLHQEMPKLKLLVVGGKGWKLTNLSEKYNSQDFPKEAVVFADYVDIKKLRNLYLMTDCYVSAALNEGFGMPQLEALRCGAPVVTAHNSAMIEVVEGRGITVRGYDVNDWITAIKQGLTINRQTLKYDLEEYEWKNITLRLKKYVETY